MVSSVPYPPGDIERQQQDGIAPASGAPEGDQTLADRDQTLADADQTASDGDQTAADSDQEAADRDQAASDRDLAHGGDRAEHDFTRDVREQSARQRLDIAQTRVDTAAARDAVAHARDLAALDRDEAAATHDRAFAARQVGPLPDGRSVIGILLRAAEHRSGAATVRAAADEGRARAAADREQAARDREQAANDREEAARDRRQAQIDRDALLQQLVLAETDQLTGTRTRAAGLEDLEHEILRARRTTGRLATSYVDVVGLKTVNDRQGHAAGDALLQHAAGAIRSHLRPYDLIIRMGGDEFLCVMSDATVQTARQRFGAIQAALAADPDCCEIRVGVAALGPDDTAADLIQRADAELPTTSRREVPTA